MEIRGFQEQYRFLSNFYLSPITVNGVLFSTVEHAYQAFKMKTLSDLMKVAECVTPGQAKRLARTLPIRQDWPEKREEVMYSLLLHKFAIPELSAQLLSTQDFLLVETNNWHDNYWGDCECPRCKNTVGENRLGKLLMKIRYIRSFKETCNAHRSPQPASRPEGSGGSDDLEGAESSQED